MENKYGTGKKRILTLGRNPTLLEFARLIDQPRFDFNLIGTQ
ncbi:hypothetical protein [Pontibacter sp. HJ8]